MMWFRFANFAAGAISKCIPVIANTPSNANAEQLGAEITVE